MAQSVKDLIESYVHSLKSIYGAHAKQIILYGSYARGDYNETSDVDIMVLVDLPEDQLEIHSDELSELGFQYNIMHGMWIMPVVKNIEHFNYWCSAYPFYENVSKEGVTLYHAA